MCIFCGDDEPLRNILHLAPPEKIQSEFFPQGWENSVCIFCINDEPLPNILRLAPPEKTQSEFSQGVPKFSGKARAPMHPCTRRLWLQRRVFPASYPTSWAQLKEMHQQGDPFVHLHIKYGRAATDSCLLIRHKCNCKFLQFNDVLPGLNKEDKGSGLRYKCSLFSLPLFSTRP